MTMRFTAESGARRRGELYAITGWPLCETELHSRGEMTNILGHEIDNWAEFAGAPDTCMHLYGKPEAREGRKMGHITRLSPL